MPSVPEPCRAGPSLRDERGIALVVAIFVLVVIGAIVAGSFFVGAMEQRTAFNTADAARAFQAAEAGLEQAIGAWDATQLNGLAPPDSVRFPTTAVTGGASHQVTVYPLNGQLFLVRSLGQLAEASQTVARVVRLVPLAFVPPAALTAAPPVDVVDDAVVQGADAVPPGWAGCTLGASQAGARSAQAIAHSSTVPLGGSPAQQAFDPLLGGSFFTDLYDSLAAMPSRALASSVVGGMAPSVDASVPPRCDRADPNNWGEPDALVPACQGYLPVLTRAGSLTVSNGRGQGVLLVDGDLILQGNVTFAGLIVARGTVQVSGTGNRIYGAIVAAAGGAPVRVEGDNVVQYSSCAVRRALQGGSRARPIVSRSWTRLF